jgi:hypothetical protein
MLVDKLREQWICSCGNWVDKEFHWCPDCCEDKLELIYETIEQKESGLRILN